MLNSVLGNAFQSIMVTSILVTYVGDEKCDNFKVLVAVLVILVINNRYLFT